MCMYVLLASCGSYQVIDKEGWLYMKTVFVMQSLIDRIKFGSFLNSGKGPNYDLSLYGTQW